MSGKKELTDALIREVKYLLRNENQTRESFNHLTLPERKVIEKLNARGYSQSQIATILGRNRSTISRELKRKGSQDYHKNYKTHKIKKEYDSHRAQESYEKARQSCGRKYKIYNCENEYMIADLEDWIFTRKLSPGSFIGQLDTGLYYGGEEFPISLSTVYRYINKGIISVDFADLIHKLNRKPRKKRVVKRIPKMIKGMSIEKRPDYINDRSELGHWEGDTIVCKGNLQCLFTLVERVTRFGIIKKIKTKSPACILKAIQQIKYEVGDLMFNRIFKSITFDNGVEFNGFKEMEEMGVKVFFTHPYSSYERGSNENFNGIVRRFLPKKTNFSKYSELDILLIQDKINDMPRKVLENYFSPHITMWFKYNRYDDYTYFPFDPITKENVEQLRKYGKAHIVYSPTKYKWVVSDKFKQ